MSGHLEKFLQAARERLAAGVYEPLGPPLPSNGSLKRALLSHPAPVIAELKRTSPSEGKLTDEDPRSLLAAFLDGGAAGVSVLTDGTFFDGSLALLRQAQGTGLPTMMKDFVVDPRQVAAAAHCGASAILLIERCFPDPAQRERLVDLAHSFGLEVLLEAFDERDCERAAASAADLIGVNARDLETLRIDARRALTLISKVAKMRAVVALSGISERAGYRQARAAGAVAALVGSALMRSPEPALFLRSLQRPLAKVCGLRSETDVEAAVRAGADFVGFVVGSPGSPRDLPPARLPALVAAARKAGARAVLVTRSSDPAAVAKWTRDCRPDYVQLHGFTASPGWERTIAPARVIQAVRPMATDLPSVSGIIIDPSEGSQRSLDIEAAAAVARKAAGRLTLVAGGLTPANARAAVQGTNAWGADASSGLEARPGLKDPRLVEDFVKAVHAA
jgi:indole-3-glycerol phosphate synthase